MHHLIALRSILISIPFSCIKESKFFQSSVRSERLVGSCVVVVSFLKNAEKSSLVRGTRPLVRSRSSLPRVINRRRRSKAIPWSRKLSPRF